MHFQETALVVIDDSKPAMVSTKLKALLSVDHDEEFVFTIDQLDKTVQVY